MRKGTRKKMKKLTIFIYSWNELSASIRSLLGVFGQGYAIICEKISAL